MGLRQAKQGPELCRYEFEPHILYAYYTRLSALHVGSCRRAGSMTGFKLTPTAPAPRQPLVSQRRPRRGLPRSLGSWLATVPPRTRLLRPFSLRRQCVRSELTSPPRDGRLVCQAPGSSSSTIGS